MVVQMPIPWRHHVIGIVTFFGASASNMSKATIAYKLTKRNYSSFSGEAAVLYKMSSIAVKSSNIAPFLAENISSIFWREREHNLQ